MIEIEACSSFGWVHIKIVAFIFVVIATVYHTLLASPYICIEETVGNNPCARLLLENGTSFKNNTWQPSHNCNFKSYDETSVSTCLKQHTQQGNSDVWFLGDSRLRYLRYWFVHKLENKNVEIGSEPKEHKDYLYRMESSNINFNFYWDPYLEDQALSKLKSVLAMSPANRPGYVFLSAALWYLRTRPPVARSVESFVSNLNKLKPVMEKVASTTSTRVVYILQDPINDTLIPDTYKPMFQDGYMNLINENTERVLADSPVAIWRSARQIATLVGDHRLDKGLLDGRHGGPKTLEMKRDLLLNVYCGDIGAPWHGLEQKSTNHCSQINHVGREPEMPSRVQIFILIVMFLYGLTTMFFGWRKKREHPDSPDFHIGVAWLTLAVILLYCLLCDRFKVFPVEEKHFSPIVFYCMLIGIFLLGAIFSTPSKYEVLLHRDHTDEWKGWMQLVILVYHFFAASKILPIYFHLRIIVSSYLFMSGYGHFCFYYTKKDFGLYRLAQVLFRMNFLVVCLCFTMGRNYQSYYFVPLVTFWYLVIYVTMLPMAKSVSKEELPTKDKTTPKATPNTWLVLSIVLATIIITLLYLFADVFSRIFSLTPWEPLFVDAHGNMHEWFFRWSLDRYSTSYGIVFGLVVMTTNKMQITKGHYGAALVLGLAGMLGYETFRNQFDVKKEYNYYHSIVTLVPLLSFVALRHVFSLVNNLYSYFYSSVGKISLELFIIQYHIWLSDDTRTTLVLVPGAPSNVNFIVISVIFAAVAHQVNEITSILANSIIPKHVQDLRRNVGIILLLCFAASQIGNNWTYLVDVSQGLL